RSVWKREAGTWIRTSPTLVNRPVSGSSSRIRCCGDSAVRRASEGRMAWPSWMAVATTGPSATVTFHSDAAGVGTGMLPDLKKPSGRASRPFIMRRCWQRRNDRPVTAPGAPAGPVGASADRPERPPRRVRSVPHGGAVAGERSVQGRGSGLAALHVEVVQVFLALVGEHGDHGAQFREALADAAGGDQVGAGAGAAQQAAPAGEPAHLFHRIGAGDAEEVADQVAVAGEDAGHETVGDAFDA